MRHFIINAILVVAATVLVYEGIDAANVLPVAAATQATSIDWLFDLQWKAMSFLFALIVVPLGYSLIVFRRRKGDVTDAAHMEGNTTLEISWTVLPLIAVVGSGTSEDFACGHFTRYPQPWKPEFFNGRGIQLPCVSQRPDGHALPPIDKQVALRMSSLDVIHSFWVPEFRVKQDLVPGQETSLHITPDRLGEYKVRCAELCGTSHTYMQASVIVLTQEDFDTKLGELQAEAEAAAASGIPDANRGSQVYETGGCKACLHRQEPVNCPRAGLVRLDGRAG
jgi:cytochrome c oxidase subunit 2